MRAVRRLLLLLAIVGLASPAFAQTPLPQIVTKNGRHALMVDGQRNKPLRKITTPREKIV